MSVCLDPLREIKSYAQYGCGLHGPFRVLKPDRHRNKLVQVRVKGRWFPIGLIRNDGKPIFFEWSTDEYNLLYRQGTRFTTSQLSGLRKLRATLVNDGLPPTKLLYLVNTGSELLGLPASCLALYVDYYQSRRNMRLVGVVYTNGRYQTITLGRLS